MTGSFAYGSVWFRVILIATKQMAGLLGPHVSETIILDDLYGKYLKLTDMNEKLADRNEKLAYMNKKLVCQRKTLWNEKRLLLNCIEEMNSLRYSELLKLSTKIQELESNNKFLHQENMSLKYELEVLRKRLFEWGHPSPENTEVKPPLTRETWTFNLN